MKQIVCLKVTPKVEQIKFDESKKTIVREGVENEINEADKNALEMALSVKDGVGGTVTVLSMGPPPFEPFLKLAIAMGADDAVLLSDRSFAGADTFATSRVLAAGMKKLTPFDIVFCSEASSDGGTEQVPPSIAEWLQVPCITYVNDLKVDSGKIVARRSIGAGYEVLEASPPALLSVELGCNTPRFPDFRRKKWADTEFKTTVWNIQDLNLSPDQVGIEGSRTSVMELRRMRAPTRKREPITGNADEIAAKLVKIIEAASSTR